MNGAIARHVPRIIDKQESYQEGTSKKYAKGPGQGPPPGGWGDIVTPSLIYKEYIVSTIGTINMPGGTASA